METIPIVSYTQRCKEYNQIKSFHIQYLTWWRRWTMHWNEGYLEIKTLINQCSHWNWKKKHFKYNWSSRRSRINQKERSPYLASNDYVNKDMNESFNGHNWKHYIKTLKQKNKKMTKHTSIQRLLQTIYHSLYYCVERIFHIYC